MSRELVISNGEVFIGFDNKYAMKDIYFPHVGQWNHTKAKPQRFGIRIKGEEGRVAWSHEDEFGRELGYLKDSMVTNVVLKNEHRLGVQVECNDAIHCNHSIYLKKIKVTNLRDYKRTVQLYFQINPWFHLTEAANSVRYEEEEKALVAYHEKAYILASAFANGNVGFNSYACGEKDEHGTRGCFMDADDGKLEMGPVAQGSVDCVGSVEIELEPGESKTAWYWMTFAYHRTEAKKRVYALNKIVRGDLRKDINRDERLADLLSETESYWRNWVNKQLTKTNDSDVCSVSNCQHAGHRDHLSMADLSEDHISLFKRSLLMVRAHSDSEGAIIAGADGEMLTWAKDSYCYAWPRDLAFCALSLDMAKYGETTRKALKFMQNVLTIEEWEGLPEEFAKVGYFEHKFNPEGSVGSSWHPSVAPNGDPQLPIQEDETALPLLSVWKHYYVHSNTEFIFEGKDSLFNNFIIPAANFLAAYSDPTTGLPHPTGFRYRGVKTDLPLASYDLWEERRGVLGFTVATVYAALKAAAQLAVVKNKQKHIEYWNAAAERYKEAFLKHLYSESLQRFVRMVNIDANGTVVYDNTIDASLFAIWYFGLLPADDPRVVRTMQEIETRLKVKTPIGGIARYVADQYHKVTDDTEKVPGNPWIICSLWVAEWYIKKAKTLDELRPAKEWLDWCVTRASRSGHLAEQYEPFTGDPRSVSPLTWSHATFVMAMLEYTAKYSELSAQEKAKA